MSGWWSGLTRRQRLGFAFYGCGVVVMLASLPFLFYREAGFDHSRTTWETLLELGDEVVHYPTILMAETWQEFVDGPLPAIGVLISYAVFLPGLGLVYLASVNVSFCWAGRVFWPVLGIVGPFVFHFVFSTINTTLEPGLGSVLWAGAVALFSAAHWVMAPVRPGLAPDGSFRTPPPAES